MRRLLIDAQVFHTPALHRGMGKYSLELLEAILQLNSKETYWDSIELLLSSKMSLTQEATELLERKAQGAALVRLPLKEDMVYDAQPIMAYNRKVIDRHIQSLFQKTPMAEVDFFILSPMQGGTSCTFPSDERVHRSLICWDLIPFMFHETYFSNSIARIENLTKLTELLKADNYVAISKTVANDLSVHLGVDPSRIHHIDAGPIKHRMGKGKSFHAPKPFILMPTGNDLRKNNRTAMLGFNEFNLQHNNRYSLVVTSFFDADQVRELSRLAENVIFTGNISGSELDSLFENCEALLFPSEYEGLGLPVLEAVEKGRPIACSDIAVFREISKTAFSLFDPAYGTSIAKALERATHAKIDTAEYASILAKYNWERAAHMLLGALKNQQSREAEGVKPKLAVFTQNPECDDALGKLTQCAHAELSRRFAVEYVIEGYAPGKVARPNMLQYLAGSKNTSDGVPLDLVNYQSLVYMLSNDGNCAKALFSALANPGVAILYELDLTKAWRALQSMGLIDETRLQAEQELQAIYGDETTQLLCSVLAQQKAIGVFSAEAKEAIVATLERMQLSLPVEVLPFPVTSLVYTDIAPQKTPTIGAYSPWEEGRGFKEFSLVNSDSSMERLTIVRPGHIITPEVPCVSVQSDADFEGAIESIGFMYGASQQQFPEVYEAMRYGALPVLYEHGADSPIAPNITPPQATIYVADATAFDQQLSRLQPKNKEYKSASTAVQKEIAAEHSFRIFAKQLAALIEKGLGKER